MPRASAKKSVMGWREWPALPDLGIPAVKAKVDTGARSSILHASGITPFKKKGRRWVQFFVRPLQRDARVVIKAEGRVVDRRNFRSSHGHTELRYVIRTRIRLEGRLWNTDLALANRDEMGFRMLLGRATVRERFTVDPGGSFLLGKPKVKALYKDMRGPKK